MLDAVITEYISTHPQHIKRVKPLPHDLFPLAETYYTIFLHNIFRYLNLVESVCRPFAFTLYPGGGFQLNDDVSDGKLKRVFMSPSFRNVIVTQPCTYSYLICKGLSASKITYIPGAVVPHAAFALLEGRRHFGIDKDTLDMGFIANRYMPRGEDKGFDLFVAAATALRKQGIRATYHVVGNWDANVIPLGELSDSFIFYGTLPTEKLKKVAHSLDLLLSPNRPNKLARGAFDGFPTQCCVEAGLQEAAIFCTDELMLNERFQDGVHIAIVRPTLEDIMGRLLPLLQEPSNLARLGRNGRLRILELYGAEIQMEPRVSLLRNLAV